MGKDKILFPSLEVREAKSLDEVIASAKAGDFPGTVLYFSSPGNLGQLKPFCEAVGSMAPEVLEGLLKLLIASESEGEGRIGPTAHNIDNVKGAHLALARQMTYAVIDYLCQNPDQALPLCKRVLGMRGQIWLGLKRLTDRSIALETRAGEERDGVILMKEVLEHLFARKGSVSRIRERFQALLVATERLDTTREIMEDLRTGTTCTLNGHEVAISAMPRPTYENDGTFGDVEFYLFLEDLRVYAPGAGRDKLLEIAKPLIDAGIDVQPQSSDGGSVADYFIVPKGDINRALAENRLIVREWDHKKFAFYAIDPALLPTEPPINRRNNPAGEPDKTALNQERLRVARQEAKRQANKERRGRIGSPGGHLKAVD